MSFNQWMVRLAVFAVMIGVTGCAGGGPDLYGPDGPALLTAYSGDWVLDPAASDDLGEELRGGLGTTGGGLPPGMTRGRRMPMTGGGRRGGAMPGGMGANPMDPQAMMLALEALRSLSQVSQELSLTLQPYQVAVAEGGAGVMIVPLDTEKEDLVQAGVLVLASARWKKNGIEIIREFEPMGAIKDTFSLSEEGNLELKREVDFLAASVKGTLTYLRKEAP